MAYQCHHQGGNQYWVLTKLGEIRIDNACLDFNGSKKNLRKPNQIFTRGCHGIQGNQEWAHEDGLLKFSSTNFCIELSAEGEDLFMNKCNKNNKRQKWKWTRRENAGQVKSRMPF